MGTIKKRSTCIVSISSFFFIFVFFYFYFFPFIVLLLQDTKNLEKLLEIMKSRLEEQLHEIELRIGHLHINLLEVLLIPILVLEVCLLAEMVLLYMMKVNKFISILQIAFPLYHIIRHKKKKRINKI